MVSCSAIESRIPVISITDYNISLPTQQKSTFPAVAEFYWTQTGRLAISICDGLDAVRLRHYNNNLYCCIKEFTGHNTWTKYVWPVVVTYDTFAPEQIIQEVNWANIFKRCLPPHSDTLTTFTKFPFTFQPALRALQQPHKHSHSLQLATDTELRSTSLHSIGFINSSLFLSFF